MILEELQAIRGELEWIEKHGKVDAKKSGKKDEEMIEGILKSIEDIKKKYEHGFGGQRIKTKSSTRRA